MEFMDWKSTSIAPGPGPLGRAIMGKYPSWDAFIKGGVMKTIKKSRRTAVYLWQGGSHAFVLKYYKTLPFPTWWPWLHGRPRRVWPIGVTLEMADIPVPAHAALVRPSVGVTVVILEYLTDATTLHAFIAAKKTNEAHFADLGRLVGRLHRLGVVHGDLKWSNILVNNSKTLDAPCFCLIDLDGAFRLKGDDAWARARDMARFLCDGIKERVGHSLLAAFMEGYYELWPAGSDLEKEIDKRLKRLLKRKNILEPT